MRMSSRSHSWRTVSARRRTSASEEKSAGKKAAEPRLAARISFSNCSLRVRSRPWIHAHVYYDPASSRDRAARLRERVAATFPGATLGRWHDTPVGPHTQSMYQIAFCPHCYGLIFAVAEAQSRDGLSILLYPGTGDAYADHIDNAVWLGSVLPLRVNVLRKSRKTPSHS